jgi:ribosomal protein L12E/L44/L45/RPP1/RPP2
MVAAKDKLEDDSVEETGTDTEASLSNEERETGDMLEEVETPADKKDILWALTTSIDKMTIEEHYEAIHRIREMRKVRIASTKKKSDLDNLLAQLSPDKASSLLKQLEAMMTQATGAPAAKAAPAPIPTSLDEEEKKEEEKKEEEKKKPQVSLAMQAINMAAKDMEE